MTLSLPPPAVNLNMNLRLRRRSKDLFLKRMTAIALALVPLAEVAMIVPIVGLTLPTAVEYVITLGASNQRLSITLLGVGTCATKPDIVQVGQAEFGLFDGRIQQNKTKKQKQKQKTKQNKKQNKNKKKKERKEKKKKEKQLLVDYAYSRTPK